MAPWRKSPNSNHYGPSLDLEWHLEEALMARVMFFYEFGFELAHETDSV